MKLMTKELEKQFPNLYEQDGKGMNAIVYARFFHPFSNWTWYATEFDPNDKLFFGYVNGFEGELGYFGLEELEEAGIERDLYFDSKPLKDALKEDNLYVL